MCIMDPPAHVHKLPSLSVMSCPRRPAACPTDSLALGVDDGVLRCVGMPMDALSSALPESSALAQHVIHVGFVIPKPKMLRIPASWIVTGMADKGVAKAPILLQG